MADLVTSLAGAIQRFEGWTSGSVSQRNNNPGNLTAGPGMIGTDASGYAIFPDYQTGWNALVNQVQLNINRGLSLDEFFAGKPGVYPGYAPAADSNQPYQYAATVGGWIGVDPTVPLNQIGTAAPAPAPVLPGGPLIDLSGAAAATPTADILAQLGIDTTAMDVIPGLDPTTLLIAGGLALVAFLVAKR